MFLQTSHYMELFQKRMQHTILSFKMLEKWKLTVDKGKSFGVLLTDLSKAFDCLLHDHLLAKLHCYRFSLPALKLIHSYLQNRKQRTKINSTYRSWEEILFRIPQGSILGTLLFNIFYVWPDLFNEWNRLCKLCRWQQTICYRW